MVLNTKIHNIKHFGLAFLSF